MLSGILTKLSWNRFALRRHGTRVAHSRTSRANILFRIERDVAWSGTFPTVSDRDFPFLSGGKVPVWELIMYSSNLSSVKKTNNKWLSQLCFQPPRNSTSWYMQTDIYSKLCLNLTIFINILKITSLLLCAIVHSELVFSNRNAENNNVTSLQQNILEIQPWFWHENTRDRAASLQSLGSHVSHRSLVQSSNEMYFDRISWDQQYSASQVPTDFIDCRVSWNWQRCSIFSSAVAAPRI